MKQTRKVFTALMSMLILVSAAFSFSVGAETELESIFSDVIYETTGDFTADAVAEADVSVYGFCPSEVGFYVVTTTTDGATLYNFSGSEFFLVNNGAAEHNTVIIEVKEGYVGNTYLFGISGVDSANINIAIDEDGEFTVTPADMPWVHYENKTTPTDFTLELGEGESLKYVNTREAHSAVLGDDGLYHLDSAEGEVLYINIGTNAPASPKLMDAVSYGQLRSYIYDSHGNFVTKEDYCQAVTEYDNCADNGVYPLTDDLIYIMQTHGNAQGWYKQGEITCIFGDTSTFNADTAWMFLCCYVPAPVVDDEPEVSEDDGVSAESGDAPAESGDDSDIDPAPTPAPELGDVNADGFINSLDAAQVLKYDAQLITFDEATLYTANTNGDGAIDSLDAAQILKYDAQLIDSFGPAEDETVYGTEDNPYIVFDAGDYFVAPGETAYFSITYKNGLVMTATADGFSEERLIIDLYEAYSFTNTGDETVILNLSFIAPLGSMTNPIELVIGENAVVIEEGSEGVFYTFTAEADGELRITMPEGQGWFYCINNMTSYVYGDNQWSDSEPVASTATVEVAEGDVIQLIFNSYDPENMWVAPAATLIITASMDILL